MEDFVQTGKDRLAHLEDKIYRISGLFNHIFSRNQQLEEEIQRLRERERLLEERCQKLQSKMDEVRRERQAVLDELVLIQEELASPVR